MKPGRGVGLALFVLIGCGSNSPPASGMGGSGGIGGSAGTGGNAGTGGISGAGGSAGTAGTGGTVGTVDAGGTADAGEADAGRSDAAEVQPAGMDAAVDLAPSPPPPDADFAPDAEPVPDDGGSINTAGLCLPGGQEKLVVRIGGAGQPALDVASPPGVTCLSRFLPADATDTASLDLTWNVDDSGLFVSVRDYDVMPGQTGTFTPYAVLISKGSDSWIGAPMKCHVTIASSQKLGEEQLPSSPLIQEVHKVSGSMTCDAWFPDRPQQPLLLFQFTTRAVLIR